MGQFSDIHLKLDFLSEHFFDDSSDELGNKIIDELVKLIHSSDEMLFAGIRREDGLVEPAGYYAHDGRFYIHIFSSKLKFDRFVSEEPRLAQIDKLWQIVITHPEIGGFSLNPAEGMGTVLITKEDIKKELEK